MAPSFLASSDEHSTPTSKVEVVTGFLPSKTKSTNGITLKSPSEQSNHESTLISRLAHLSDRHPNPSLVVSPSHTLTVTETPIPCPKPTEALLHIRCTGICGSDLHLWRRGNIGPLAITSPCILGHEAAGVVLAVGANVINLKPGDHVAIEPGVPCQKCFLCKNGRYNLCERVKFCGVGTDACEGSIRRFMCHDAQYCHVMLKGMSWKTGALLEPLSVVMHALAECGGMITLGRPVLVCGAGPIGLIGLKAARASGAWPLVITDVDEGRLDFARSLVPGVKTWLVDEALSEVENAERVRELFGSRGGRDVERGLPDQDEYMAPQVVLECTGVESSVATAAYVCRRGGMVMVVGVGKDKMNNLPFMHLSLAEIQLRFINRYKDMWPAAMNVLAEGKVMDLDQLVTHTFSLERAVEAMETCANRSSGSIKVHIVDEREILL